MDRMSEVVGGLISNFSVVEMWNYILYLSFSKLARNYVDIPNTMFKRISCYSINYINLKLSLCPNAVQNCISIFR